MKDNHDGLYDKYRVIKTEDLDKLAKIAEDDGQPPHIVDAAVETVKWVEAAAISGSNDKGFFEGPQFVFVLRPDKDYHAWVALQTYAASVYAHNPVLCEDILQAIGLISVPTNMDPD